MLLSREASLPHSLWNFRPKFNLSFDDKSTEFIGFSDSTSQLISFVRIESIFVPKLQSEMSHPPSRDLGCARRISLRLEKFRHSRRANCPRAGTGSRFLSQFTLQTPGKCECSFLVLMSVIGASHYRNSENSSCITEF